MAKTGMVKTGCKLLVCVLAGILMFGCAGQKSRDRFDAEKLDNYEALPDPNLVELKGVEAQTLDPDSLNLDTYMTELVDNFIVILDASGSKYLPYKQQTKFFVAKDIARRFNQKVPDRPLVGGLRRYGWEAGAFTTNTELIYGMTDYNREDYAEAIEILRWAGGKTPMSIAIDAATEDFAVTEKLMALVLISDGKVLKKDPYPVDAARAMKARYGDRLCIYTVTVGDDIPFDPALYHEKYQLMTDIARAGECGYMVRAEDLVSDDAMSKFADDVFNRRHTLQPREQTVKPCTDEDQDGVCDEDDLCPGTPIGAKVDEHGCWIIERVHFDLNKWNIKPQYYEIIDDVARVMNLNPDLKLEVHGHTCTIWTEEYNQKLSHWRAMSVTSYLMKKGVSSDRLIVKGFGYHQPMASNATEETRALNRRAEFKPIKPVR